MNRRFIALNLLLLASAAISAHAEIRKWVDEQGRVHYEDAPGGTGGAVKAPASAEQEQALTPEQERLQKQKRLLEAMESERRARQQEKEQAGKERKQAAAKCENARQELTRRRNARYLYRKAENGERAVLSEEDRAEATAEAEAAVKKWCK